MSPESGSIYYYSCDICKYYSNLPKTDDFDFQKIFLEVVHSVKTELKYDNCEGYSMQTLTK